MNEAWKLDTILHNIAGRARAWFDTIGAESLVLAAFFFVVIVVFRKPFANVLISLAAALLKRLSITLSTEVRSKLTETCAILLVALAFFIVVETLALPETPGGLLRKIVFSVAVVSVFSAWYELVGPFLRVLHRDRPGLMVMETEWVERVTKFAILLFGITALLKVWDIDISGALTGVGVLGAGLAIAAQDLVRNLIAGMTNMSEKRFETGDAIEIAGGVSGVVERIDLRSTLLVGFDLIPRYVPNSDLSNAVVLNYSDQKRRRVLAEISLEPGATRAQIEDVRDRLKDYLQTSGDFATTPDAAQYVTVKNLEPGSIDIQFYAYTKAPSYMEYLNITERLSLEVLGIVEAAGTELAVPMQAIQFKDVPTAQDVKAITSSNS